MRRELQHLNCFYFADNNQFSVRHVERNNAFLITANNLFIFFANFTHFALKCWDINAMQLQQQKLINIEIMWKMNVHSESTCCEAQCTDV